MQKKKTTKSLLLKLLAGLLALCLLGAVGILAVNAYVKASVRDKIVSPEEALAFEPDCILVLGAGVYAGGVPSPMLQDRLSEAISLYKAGVSDRLLMSGDHGEVYYDEVNVMKAFALDRGLPSEHVFMDHAGFSTYESLYRARDVFAVRRLVIVTQEYHLYRALYIARALGLEAVGVASDPRAYAGQDYRELREIAARCKDAVYSVFKPLPTFLGEVIPISGSGDATNDLKEY